MNKESDKLAVAARTVFAVLSTYGDWEDGCFYYKGTSASELQMPLMLLREALREEISTNE